MAGAETMRELARFILGFQGMYEGFVERSNAVQELFHDKTTAFVVVTSGQRQQQQSALHFHKDLRKEGFHIAGFIGNRMQRPHTLLTEGKTLLDWQQTMGLPDNHELMEALNFNIALNRQAIESQAYLQKHVGNQQLIFLPEIHNTSLGLKTLVELQSALFPL